MHSETLKFLIITTYITVISTTICSAQTCTENTLKTLVKVSNLPQYELQTCNPVTGLQTHLSNFMNLCTNQVYSASSFLMCNTECLSESLCNGYVYSDTNGCELCIESGSATPNIVSQSFFIVAEKFENYIIVKLKTIKKRQKHQE